MRTTIDIDDPILKELKHLRRSEGEPLGRLVSDLLARSLANERESAVAVAPALKWVSRPMRARVDLADRDAVLDAMDGAQR